MKHQFHNLIRIKGPEDVLQTIYSKLDLFMNVFNPFPYLEEKPKTIQDSDYLKLARYWEKASWGFTGKPSFRNFKVNILGKDGEDSTAESLIHVKTAAGHLEKFCVALAKAHPRIHLEFDAVYDKSEGLGFTGLRVTFAHGAEKTSGGPGGKNPENSEIYRLWSLKEPVVSDNSFEETFNYIKTAIFKAFAMKKEDLSAGLSHRASEEAVGFWHKNYAKARDFIKAARDKN